MGVGGQVGGGVRVDVNEEVKLLYIIKTKLGEGVGGVGRIRLGVKGESERRIEVIVKMQKKVGGGRGWGVEGCGLVEGEGVGW